MLQTAEDIDGIPFDASLDGLPMESADSDLDGVPMQDDTSAYETPSKGTRYVKILSNNIVAVRRYIFNMLL